MEVDGVGDDKDAEHKRKDDPTDDIQLESWGLLESNPPVVPEQLRHLGVTGRCSRIALAGSSPGDQLLYYQGL